tara:strand:+ start:120 stop:1145 length:1026 start_codon:yes stop_codon:yes gene_type:complete
MLKKLNFRKFKKIVFLVFGSNHRHSALGEFGKSKNYEDILLISLGGRFKSLLGRILYFFKIGKFIAIDANPFFKNKINSINLWFNGTWKIFKEFKGYSNNFVNIKNPIINEEQNIFQIYPLIYEKKKFYKKPKIIFMGKIWYTPNENLVNSNFLHSNKNKILNKFNLIDDKNFWLDDKDNKEIETLYKKYRIIKTYLREQIILSINKNFKNNFLIYGEDRNNTGLNFQHPVYNSSAVKKIYEGNICIDTGPVPGSMSLHPRSLMILESNGLLIQAKQNDSELVWGNLSEKMIFNDIENLLTGIDLILSDLNKFNEFLSMIYEKFENSEYQIYNTLKNTLKL